VDYSIITVGVRRNGHVLQDAWGQEVGMRVQMKAKLDIRQALDELFSEISVY
jgi:hypothetical protein